MILHCVGAIDCTDMRRGTNSLVRLVQEAYKVMATSKRFVALSQ